ncbi:MAG: FAD-dependent oxidoreductase [Negativicutes bacterium]|nr:FAD-dependent oxidoreductase [Negativicutes bacterium]
MHDLIIIGCGPAGMTAAVYAARKKMDILMLTEEFGGQPMWTRDIENYMGYQYITGPELMGKFEEQTRQYPLKILYEKVTGISQKNDGNFIVTTTESSYQSKTVIIASGKRPRRLEVPGEQQFTGRGVSYCATCDGPLFAGKTVAVVGGGNSAVQAAVELSKVAEKVYLVSRSAYVADQVVIDKMKQADNIIEMQGYDSVSIEGSEFVETYKIRRKETGEIKELEVQGIFVEVGLIPNSEFVSGLADKNRYGEIIVDCRAATKTSGLFAAGDVTDGPDKQIVIAAGDGSKAALGAYDYLLYTAK